MNTTETLKALAPEFVALDEAERIIASQPSKEGYDYVDIVNNVKLIVRKTRALLDAHAQALLRIQSLEEIGGE